MPLPGTRVFDPRWNDHNRPVATGTMTSECVIYRVSSPDGSTGDDGTWSPSVSTAIYSGPCRVSQDTSDEENPIMGDRRLTTIFYNLQIRYDAEEIRIGDVVDITASADAKMIGSRFRVEGVRVGSEQWSRNLVVIEFERGS